MIVVVDPKGSMQLKGAEQGKLITANLAVIKGELQV